MSQLVGRGCVICGKSITSVLDAQFCHRCGNSVHRNCLETYQPSQEDSSGCPHCGGTRESPPVQAAPISGINPLWVAVILTIFVIMAPFVIWVGIRSMTKTSANRETAEPAVRADLDANRRVIDSALAAAKESATNPIVEIQTTMGTIRAELFADKAPKTVRNFLELVEQEYYDGIIFHRVIDKFMIQTGDPLGTGAGGREDKGLPKKFLPDEFHSDLRHDKPGILSMANSGPNSGDTQFFITTVPTPWLDDKHSVFGQVIDGLDVVHKIETVKTSAERPLREVKMIQVRLVEDEGKEEPAKPSE